VEELQGGGIVNQELSGWVSHAVQVAMRSLCQSKRGVVISSDDGQLIAEGYNHQPRPFQCDGSDACNRNCGKTAVHAEQSAIVNAPDSLLGAWMLHVKAKDGLPCASVAPSCLECSKLILVSGIAWMHLLHDPQAQMLPSAEVVGEVDGFQSDGHYGKLQIRRYSAAHFHWLTAEYAHCIPLILPAKVAV
jgi:deoxycytidylate deaminase